MRITRPTSIVWMLLCCVALIATRIAGDHLHLCFDGSEPPVSLHALDLDAHHASDEIEHDDQDVQLPSAAMVKAFKLFGDAPFLIALFSIVALLLPRDQRTFGRRTDPAPKSLLFDLLPPLRGPPAQLPR